MSPQDRPVTLRAGPLNIYVLFGPKNIKTIFKNSKVLDKGASTMMIFRNLGMSQEDMDVLNKDDSGLAAQPLSEVSAENRVWKNTHDLGAKYLLNGHCVNMLTNMFVKQFLKELDKEPANQSFTAFLYDYFRKAMFVASTKSLVGTEIFPLCPDLVSNYWEFDDGFLQVAVGLPRLLFPKQYAASERMLDCCRKWINHAWDNFDQRNADTDWEENFGSSYSRKMVHVLADSGLSKDGQAIAMLPILWA
jgi:hypothetical protein